MSQNELIDNLYESIKEGSIQIILRSAGEGWSHITFKTRDGYQFDATAYPQPIDHWGHH